MLPQLRIIEIHWLSSPICNIEHFLFICPTTYYKGSLGMALLYWCTHINMKYTNELNLYCQFICVFVCLYNTVEHGHPWNPNYARTAICKVFQDSYARFSRQLCKVFMTAMQQRFSEATMHTCFRNLITS